MLDGIIDILTYSYSNGYDVHGIAIGPFFPITFNIFLFISILIILSIKEKTFYSMEYGFSNLLAIFSLWRLEKKEMKCELLSIEVIKMLIFSVTSAFNA